MSQAQPKKSVLDIILPYFNGGFSGCVATCVVQPIDMIKVQIQIKSELISQQRQAGQPITESASPIGVIKDIHSRGGVALFYKGLSAGLTRQVFYTTTRFGIYQNLIDKTKKRAGNRSLTFFEKSYCGVTAGFIGSICGTPSDLALIRMQNDASAPINERRNYTGVFDAFKRIIAEEGVTGLWKGVVPTVVRAMALNFAMLGVYDEIKEKTNQAFNGDKSIETMKSKLLAAAATGFTTSFASLPFDNVKTKMQKQRPGPDGKLPYANIFDGLMKSAKNEGVAGLWVGYPTFYLRIAPHVMITLVMNDVLKDVQSKMRSQKH